MGPIAYALCAKPVIGLMMYATAQCAFPPLFQGVPLAMAQAGATATARFTVPVDKSYPLLVNFTFPDNEARLRDRIVGERHDSYCDGRPYAQVPSFARDGLGQPIPLRVVVRRQGDGRIVAERTVDSLCVSAHDLRSRKSRHVADVALTRGDYIAEITNLAAQPGLAGVAVDVMLAGGMGK